MTVYEGMYFTFVFVAAVGVLQITAVINGLNGLLLIRSRAAGLLIGIFLLAGDVLWFLPASRGYVLPGVEGLQQGILFSLASGGAVLLTLALASLLQLGHADLHDEAADGLGAFREMTLWQIVRLRLKSKFRGKVLRY